MWRFLAGCLWRAADPPRLLCGRCHEVHCGGGGTFCSHEGGQGEGAISCTCSCHLLVGV